jgi:hypothetical protein
MASPLSADVPGQLSYQGYLTNGEGVSLDTVVQMIFTIYDSTGVSKWSEEHIVTVSEGILNVVLGSKTAIPDTVFNGENRYLGITIGNDPEISPRTLLTSSPQTFISQRVDGDIETSAGAMVLKQSSGDSAIIISAGSDRAHPPEMVFNNVNTEPLDPLIEIIADPVVGPSMGFYDEIGQVMGFEPTPFNEAFSMYLMDPADDGKLFELTGNHITDEVNMFFMDPGDDGKYLSISGAPSSGANIKMFNPQPEPPAILMEMGASYGAKALGAGFILYNPSLDVIGEPLISISSEFGSGGSIKMFNPQPEPPAEVIFEMNTVPNTGSSIKMFNPQPEPPAMLLEISGTYGVKGGSSEISLYDDTDNLESHLTPGKLELHTAVGPSMGPPIFLEATAYTARVGIGTNIPSEELYVAGDICYTGSIGACSDARYKTDVATLSCALEKVSRLRGVSFNWRRDEYPRQKFSDDEQVGLIAQEVEEVFPQIVSQTDDGYYNVDYSKLTPLLVEAIKELKAQNEELKSVNEELNRRVEKLESEGR